MVRGSFGGQNILIPQYPTNEMTTKRDDEDYAVENKNKDKMNPGIDSRIGNLPLKTGYRPIITEYIRYGSPRRLALQSYHGAVCMYVCTSAERLLQGAR